MMYGNLYTCTENWMQVLPLTRRARPRPRPACAGWSLPVPAIGRSVR